MNRLDQAREIVRRYPLPETLRALVRKGDAEVHGEDLARALDYFIGLDLTVIEDETAVPLGASKYKGLPHLPPSVGWPAKHYFTAQYHLADLHPHDIHDAFPATGMLYLFRRKTHVTVIHYDGPLDALRVTPYPDPEDLPKAKHHYQDHLDESALITFQPYGIVDPYAAQLSADQARLGDHLTPDNLPRLLPEDLVSQVRDVLRGPIARMDHRIRVFGRPTYWQDEDDWSDPESWERLDLLVELDVMSAEEAEEERRPRHLILQDDNNDNGSGHYWVGAQDAARRDYSGCWLTVSKT